MFCNKCGNKIDDRSVFCSWCGAHIDNPAAPTVPQPASAAPQEKPPVPDAAAGGYAAPREEVRSAAPNSTNTAAAAFPGIPSGNPEPADSGTPDGVPRPVETAKSGWSTEVAIDEKPQKPEKTRKYYTGAHLALCLVTTGIMAMAAGVFAALYFMTIL